MTQPSMNCNSWLKNLSYIVFVLVIKWDFIFKSFITLIYWEWRFHSFKMIMEKYGSHMHQTSIQEVWNRFKVTYLYWFPHLLDRRKLNLWSNNWSPNQKVHLTCILLKIFKKIMISNLMIKKHKKSNLTKNFSIWSIEIEQISFNLSNLPISEKSLPKLNLHYINHKQRSRCLGVLLT